MISPIQLSLFRRPLAFKASNACFSRWNVLVRPEIGSYGMEAWRAMIDKLYLTFGFVRGLSDPANGSNGSLANSLGYDQCLSNLTKSEPSTTRYPVHPLGNSFLSYPVLHLFS
jgi:hypothetical protein